MKPRVILLTVLALAALANGAGANDDSFEQEIEFKPRIDQWEIATSKDTFTGKLAVVASQNSPGWYRPSYEEMDARCKDDSEWLYDGWFGFDEGGRRLKFCSFDRDGSKFIWHHRPDPKDKDTYQLSLFCEGATREILFLHNAADGTGISFKPKSRLDVRIDDLPALENIPVIGHDGGVFLVGF